MVFHSEANSPRCTCLLTVWILECVCIFPGADKGGITILESSRSNLESFARPSFHQSFQLLYFFPCRFFIHLHVQRFTLSKCPSILGREWQMRSSVLKSTMCVLGSIASINRPLSLCLSSSLWIYEHAIQLWSP